MHLFDFLGRAKARSAPAAAPVPAIPAEPPKAAQTPPQPVGAEELRRLLFGAVAAGDAERLTCLCREHEGGILRFAQAWMEVPEALRSNPAAMRWYGDGLRVVAHFCADVLGRPDLFQRMEELGTATPGVQ